MSSKPALRSIAVVLLFALAALACQAAEGILTGGVQPPESVTAAALNRSTVRVDWSTSTTAQRYRLERRTNLTGAFQRITEVGAGVTTYFDTGLDPETFYGYRIVSLDRLDEASPPSVVAGARTAPLPGIQVRSSLGGPAALADPNGYLVHVGGPKDTTLSLAVVDDQILSPLPAGTYTVTLRDISATCAVQPVGDSVRTVIVSDTGLTTRALTQFAVNCIDPTLGTIVAEVNVTGDSTDTDGYRLDYAGIIPGDTVPVIGGFTFNGAGGAPPSPAFAPATSS